tara:strand:+ start:36 stop:536 length:501 start_codon:yes stop_codon:yes gene_type:complete
MATTVKNATLKVTVKEEIVLNGSRQDSENILRISDINEVYKRIVKCPANVDTTVFRSGVTVDVTDSSVDVQDVKYIRLTNLDALNPVNVNLQIDVTESGSGASAVNETATILLEAGHSFVMGTSHDSIAAYDTDGSAQTTLHDLESILIDPSANAVDIEIFVASAS